MCKRVRPCQSPRLTGVRVHRSKILGQELRGRECRSAREGLGERFNTPQEAPRFGEGEASPGRPCKAFSTRSFQIPRLANTSLKESLEQLNDIPDALIIVAENDVLRDQGEAYARKLIQAGVNVTSTCYNNTIHDFVVLNALADSGAARGAIAQANAALRTVFYSE